MIAKYIFVNCMEDFQKKHTFLLCFCLKQEAPPAFWKRIEAEAGAPTQKFRLFANSLIISVRYDANATQ